MGIQSSTVMVRGFATGVLVTADGALLREVRSVTVEDVPDLGRRAVVVEPRLRLLARVRALL